jgi:hypothetical protein
MLPCTLVNSSSSSAQISELNFTPNDQLINTLNLYSDPSCSDSHLTQVSTDQLTFNADQSITETPTVVDLQFNTAVSVDQANHIAACQRKNWQLNVPQDILGTNCSPEISSKINVILITPSLLRVTSCSSANECVSLDYQRVSARI